MYNFFKTAATLLICTLSAANGANYSNFIRQERQETNVVWDMPVNSNGTGPAALMVQEGGALFQLWTIEQATAKDFLLDQKLVGAYLPKGEITIHTQDSYNGIPRIRVDQPFSVDFQVSNLLNGPNIPIAATKVLAEHHLAPNPDGSLAITLAQAISGAPFASGYIATNGITTVKYAASSLPANDPRKARGEEHFVLHALSDGNFSQTHIATAFLQVWPIATGEIKGITSGELIRGIPPTLTMSTKDLYPRSNTILRIHSSGTQIGAAGVSIPGSELVLDQEFPVSRNLTVDDYGKLFDSDGPYRIDLLTETPFGTERLDSVSFTVNRSLRINAMQVDAFTAEN